MQSSIRVRIHRNSAQQSQGFLVNIHATWTWEDFLSKCAQKLQIPSAQLVFSKEGDIIDSLDAMRDDDELYISQGEHFYPPPMNLSSNRSSQIFSGSSNTSSSSSSHHQRSDYYRIAVVGPAAVGKSSIVMRYIKGQFPSYYDPTIESNYTRPQQVDGKVIELDILDTAGMEQYEMIKDLSIKDREYFVYVFDVNERSSFDKLSEKYLDYHNSQPRLKGKPVLLVGNKIDKTRMVKREESENLAKKFGAQYYETSALNNLGIEPVFQRMALLIKQTVEPAAKKKTAKKKVSWFKRYCRIL